LARKKIWLKRNSRTISTGFSDKDISRSAKDLHTTQNFITCYGKNEFKRKVERDAITILLLQ